MSNSRGGGGASRISNCLLSVVGIILSFLSLWALLASIKSPHHQSQSSSFSSSSSLQKRTPSDIINSHSCNSNSPSSPLKCEPEHPTFYDDPTITFSIENPINDWDRKRAQWLKYHHSSYTIGLNQRILVVTGSQPSTCPHPDGDHTLLRFFKNKVDYCRIHGYDIFYNNALLHPKMSGCWAKIQIIKSAMLAHPEAEWIFWIDSDAAFTDMDFKVPLERYSSAKEGGGYNLIIHGWEYLIYEASSWTGANAGVFLLRNCQWSMDLLAEWAKMGPQTPNFDDWGKIQTSTLKDKIFPQADDQSGLIYLLLTQKDKWAEKTYIENEYPLHGYWTGIVDRYVNVTDRYTEIEAMALRGSLRRRHAEKVSEHYGELWDKELKHHHAIEYGSGDGWWKRPFVTHFTGCQPCTGNHAGEYKKGSCWEGMNKALNFADNQVLRNYGFVHPDLLDSSVVPVSDPHYFATTL